MTVKAQIEGGPTLEFPDGTDPSVVQATVKKVIAGQAPKADPNPNKLHSVIEDLDVAASLGTGTVASLAGGIVKATGYAREGVETALTGKDPGDASAAAAKLEDLLTYSPKTEHGKAVMADVNKGLQAFEAWTDKQGAQATQAILAGGNKASEVAKAMGAPQAVVDFIDRHKEQVAAAYGSATKTGLNAAPLAAGEALKLAPKAAETLKRVEGAPPAAPAPTSAPDLTLAPSPPRAAPGAPAAVPATAAPLEAAPTVPRGPPSTIGEGPLPPPAPPVSPTARAQAYARDRLGLSWDALGEATRAKLTRVAADAQGLDRLNPEAVKRQAKLEALRVPIRTTAGKLSRDNAQLLKEQGAAATTAGEPINRIDIEANRDLRRNVEVLVDRLRGVGGSKAVTTRGEKVGEVVAGKGENPGALTRLQQAAKARTKAAYEAARSTEPDATVPADPMYEFIRGNPEVLNPQIQHLSWLNTWLKKAGIEKLDETGAPTGERRPIKAVELDDLRKKAGKMAGGAGDSAHYAKEVMGVIDQMFDEGLPAAAEKWKAARQAHSAERGEFKNQGALDRLVGKKGGNFGTDPKTALEDVWKVSIKNARIEEVRQVKRSLISGKTPELRLEGKKALRTLRAATAQNMLDEIQKGVSTNAAGEANITAESIGRWIKGMGNDGTLEGGWEKLDAVWGRKATRELKDIFEAAQITKTEPTVRNVGSNTFQKILNWMDESGLGGAVKSLGGGPIVHAAEGIAKLAKNPMTVRAATKDATAAGEAAGRKASIKEGELLYNQRETAKRNQPTYGQEP